MRKKASLHGNRGVLGKRRRANRQLRLESLENRSLLAATVAATGIAVQADEFHGLTAEESTQLKNLAALGDPKQAAASTAPAATKDRGGNLVIHGCAGSDKVVAQNLWGADGHAKGKVRLTQYVNGQWIRQQDFTGVKTIVFLAYNGTNEFHNVTGLPSKVLGGSGGDTFNGGTGVDTLFGLGGTDKLSGKGGSDKLFGGTGADRLEAGGMDAAESQCANLLRGGKGNDVLVGSGGSDSLYGNDDNDVITKPGSAYSYLDGGAGNDELHGVDYVSPNKIRLEMRGGDGTDKLYVKPGVYSERLWSSDIYHDDDVFRSQTTRMASLNAVFAQEDIWLL